MQAGTDHSEQPMIFGRTPSSLKRPWYSLVDTVNKLHPMGEANWCQLCIQGQMSAGDLDPSAQGWNVALNEYTFRLTVTYFH